ncbi:hypothetical protein CN602_06905 [Bacillus cereus]|uniref:hypothetical protein n=1 Tax=Bacillus cereus TaxID=1396 RepID=UPI000BEF1C00|nr:hypothetical protein [Bacillus cereus]PEM04816.1 hypothetical protein CN602_06905 [Bacillus cereus]
MKTLLNDFISQFKENKDTIGIVLVGSSSRGYQDTLSDFDVEVIVTDSYYNALATNNLFERSMDGKVEILLLPESDFKAKKDSPADIDHWPYEFCEILYDPNRILYQEIAQIKHMPPMLGDQRAKLHYFEFLFCIQRTRKLLLRGDELNTRLCVAKSLQILIKLFFVLQNQWVPVIHWSSQNLNDLDYFNSMTKQLMLEIMRKPNIRIAEKLIKETDIILENKKFQFQYDKEALTEEVCSYQYRSIREQYGTL